MTPSIPIDEDGEGTAQASPSLEKISAVLEQCVAYANTAHALPIGSMAARHYRRLAESKRRVAFWLSRKLTQASGGER